MWQISCLLLTCSLKNHSLLHQRRPVYYYYSYTPYLVLIIFVAHCKKKIFNVLTLPIPNKIILFLYTLQNRHSDYTSENQLT